LLHLQLPHPHAAEIALCNRLPDPVDGGDPRAQQLRVPSIWRFDTDQTAHDVGERSSYGTDKTRISLTDARQKRDECIEDESGAML
jgi:hypothetical protein